MPLAWDLNLFVRDHVPTLLVVIIGLSPAREVHPLGLGMRMAARRIFFHCFHERGAVVIQ